MTNKHLHVRAPREHLPASPKRIFTPVEWEHLISVLGLTIRQAQVLGGVLSARSDKQIAWDLNLSLPTIRLHLNHVRRKLNAQSRQEVIINLFVLARRLYQGHDSKQQPA